MALMAIVCGVQHDLSAGDILKNAEVDLKTLTLLKGSIPVEMEQPVHPRVTAAAQARETVRVLKEQGLSRTEVAMKLGMAKTTVQRHWNRSD